MDDNAKEVITADRAECENRCLTERLFTCRSASFNQKSNKCFLSQSNRHVSPNNLKSEFDFEYLENMCLKRMSNPTFINQSLNRCLFYRQRYVQVERVYH